MNKCETCRYFASRFCHRYPPIVYDLEARAEFANVEPLDWCGEWRESKEAEMERALEIGQMMQEGLK